MSFLANKTAIITGAGYAVLSDGRCGSIGYGIATAYAKEGANLVITGRNLKKLEAAKEALEGQFGIRVLPAAADIYAGADNQTAAEGVVKQAIETFGGIQVLINCAQASASGVPLAEHTTEQFDLAIYSGLYAAFYIYESMLSVSGGVTRQCDQFCVRRGSVRKLRTERLRGSQRGDSRHDASCRDGMGKGRNQCKPDLSVGMDRKTGRVSAEISGSI